MLNSAPDKIVITLKCRVVKKRQVAESERESEGVRAQKREREREKQVINQFWAKDKKLRSNDELISGRGHLMALRDNVRG